MIIIAEWQINTFRKSIRFIQFLKLNFYNLIRKKIADYPNHPNHLKEIGFLKLVSLENNRVKRSLKALGLTE